MKQIDPIERVRLELVSRKFLVTLLALICVWIGIIMILTGAPDFLEEWLSPWSRYYIGGTAAVFGMISVAASVIGDGRRLGWWTQIVGLAGVAAWYLSFAVVYCGLIVREGGIDIVGPGVPLDAAHTGRAYVPLIYLTLSAMAAIPLVTMLRIGPPSKTPTSDPLAGS